MPSDSEDEFRPAKKARSVKGEEGDDQEDGGAAFQRNDQGEAFLELGKKGISLTLEQYEALRDIVVDGSLDAQVEELK